VRSRTDIRATRPDEAILAVKKSGSVMGITACAMFVSDKEPTTIDSALDHFDYVAEAHRSRAPRRGQRHRPCTDTMPCRRPLNAQLRAGYKGSYGFRDKIDIEGLNHPKRMFDLTEGLHPRKYSDANIEGILGGNFRRVPHADLDRMSKP
jgi:membrane dipeptidase